MALHKRKPPKGTAGALPPPPPPPPPPPMKSPPKQPQGPPLVAPGLIQRFVARAKGFAGKTLRVGGAACGLFVVANLSFHCIESKQVDNFFGAAASVEEDDENVKKSKQSKRALVLPFDNMKVVERRKGIRVSDLLGNVSPSLQSLSVNGERPSITLEAKELVDIIRKAAADPNVTALHATFGEGMRFPMGYGHIEEVRDALRVFNETPGALELNGHHDPASDRTRNGVSKRSFAFGHSFGWRDYFLASACSYIDLQSRGCLDLFGFTSTNIFLKGALDKYGVKILVFRHGDYKNAPSIFTDKKFSKAHLKSVKSMTLSMNTSIQNCINKSRVLNFDNIMWASVFKFGTLTAANAEEIGLVSATPPSDPLVSLLDVIKKEDEAKDKNTRILPYIANGKLSEKKTESKDEVSMPRKKLEAKFDRHFTATEVLSLEKYKQMLKKRENVERRRKQFKNALQQISDKSTATSMLLSTLGLHPGEKSGATREKVAVLTVDGSMNDSLSYEVIRSLRNIRHDEKVQCMVLRVNSTGGSGVVAEAILEEIKLFEKPVICSMSNAAASAGYYITTTSEKIFALSTTRTGSIGIFGLKVDASKWANDHGISADHYPLGSHEATNHPLVPLTSATQQNIAKVVRNWYEYFKTIVAAGRSLSLEQVEEVAQGRVWTGAEAKEVGLVDALGGLDSAISYAKESYTKTQEVEVEHWPKAGSFADIFQSGMGSNLDGKAELTSKRLLSALTELTFTEKPHYMMTMDENAAIEMLIERA